MKFNNDNKQKQSEKPKSDNGIIMHTVKNGETLDSIMDEYGVSFADLKGLNRISNITNVKIGGIIRIK